MKSIFLVLCAIARASAQRDVAFELNDRGLEATEKRQFDDAEKLFQKAIARWQELGPKFAAHLATTKMNLAQVYGGQGRRADCAATLEESLTLFRGSLGITDARSLTTLNLLGGMYMMLGNHARAAALFAEALPIERKLYPTDIQLARTLGGMASLNLREDRAEEAMPLAEEALAVTLKAEGDDTLDAALAYANMAETHRVLGRSARALPLFRKSRSIYERLLGPEHPRVGSVLAQEGLLLLADGKLGLAEQSLERSLAIVEKSCPGCALERATSENDLALLRIRQGRFADADRLLSDVLTLQEKADGLPGSQIAVTLESLAIVRQKERRFEDAERLKRRAALLLSSYR